MPKEYPPCKTDDDCRVLDPIYLVGCCAYLDSSYAKGKVAPHIPTIKSTFCIDETEKAHIEYWREYYEA